MASCRGTVPDYVELGCNEFESGRITAIAFIDENVTFTDITDPTEWTNLSYDTDILIHNEVSGSYSKPSPTEIAGKGKQDTKVVGRKHEIQCTVLSIKGNDAYWNSLNKSSNYKVAFVVGSDYDLLFCVDKTVTIDAAAQIEESLDSEAQWLVTIKWSDIDLPSTSDVPEGVFD